MPSDMSKLVSDLHMESTEPINQEETVRTLREQVSSLHLKSDNLASALDASEKARVAAEKENAVLRNDQSQHQAVAEELGVKLQDNHVLIETITVLHTTVETLTTNIEKFKEEFKASPEGALNQLESSGWIRANNSELAHLNQLLQDSDQTVHALSNKLHVTRRQLSEEHQKTLSVTKDLSDAHLRLANESRWSDAAEVELRNVHQLLGDASNTIKYLVTEVIKAREDGEYFKVAAVNGRADLQQAIKAAVSFQDHLTRLNSDLNALEQERDQLLLGSRYLVFLHCCLFVWMVIS